MDVIKMLANTEGVSEKEMREEMQKAIRLARENPDPKVQMMWSSLFPNAKEPTPEEFINVIAKVVKEKQGH